MHETGAINLDTPRTGKEVLDQYMIHRQNAVDRRNLKFRLELEEIKNLSVEERAALRRDMHDFADAAPGLKNAKKYVNVSPVN